MSRAVGDNIDIAWAAGAAAAALMWAAWLVWCDLFARRHPPHESLRAAAATFDLGDAAAALALFRRAGRIAARYGDLAALGAAWRGIALAREALGDQAGAEAAALTACDAEGQVSASSRHTP